MQRQVLNVIDPIQNSAIAPHWAISNIVNDINVTRSSYSLAHFLATWAQTFYNFPGAVVISSPPAFVLQVGDLARVISSIIFVLLSKKKKKSLSEKAMKVFLTIYGEATHLSPVLEGLLMILKLVPWSLLERYCKFHTFCSERAHGWMN